VKVVTYHRSFSNLADRFGLNVIGYIEPKPGVPPSPQHTLDLINGMKKEGVKLALVEPYFDLKTPNKIAADTGGAVVVLLPSVGGVRCSSGAKCEATDYIGLFDYDINLLVNAIRKTGAK
jgi:ABC-type Zn uptake system ZnuABC Zn-binding protein ZnuA